jgi:GNAT superfamily N-acetyltransferase
MSLDHRVEVPADFHRIGLLTWRDGQPVQVPFFARLLEPAALAEVQDIHQEALRRLSEPGLVRTDSDAFFAHHFSGEGRILGVFAEDRLIAYGILSLPAGPDYRYDRFLEDLDLPASEWPRMAQLIGVAVRPEWRGNGLHRRLCEWRLELAHAVHRWQIAAVSAPGNPCSWRNLLAVGLRVTNIKMLGGDKLRYLLHADLRGAPSLDPTTTVTCAVSDMAEQQALLARGYRGYAAVMEQNVLHIRYARPLPP